MEQWQRDYEKFLLEPITLASGIYSPEAVEWKDKNFPRIFYKYGNLSGNNYIDSIENDYIYLNSIDKFEDKKECCASVMYFKKYGVQNISDEKLNQYGFLLRNILNRTQFNAVLDISKKNNCSLTDFLVCCYQKAKCPPDLIDNAVQIIMAQLDNGDEQVYKAYQEMFRRDYLIGCITHKPRSRKMWKKYAESYTGVCIEYDISPIIGDCFPVYYYHDIPDFDYITSNSLYYYAMCRKTSDWDFEEEMRIVKEREKGHCLSLKAKSLTVTEQCCRLSEIECLAKKKEIPLHMISSGDISC